MNENDWMADPELVRLAEQLPGAAPPLDAAALARVEQRMRDELDRSERRTRWRRVAFGLGMAASVLLAICGYAYFRSDDKTVSPPVARNANPPAPVIEERITIAVSNAPPLPASEKPLVRLDDYRSLFAD